jgi:hypothetical protein
MSSETELLHFSAVPIADCEQTDRWRLVQIKECRRW